jgi:hypothetical protein
MVFHSLKTTDNSKEKRRKETILLFFVSHSISLQTLLLPSLTQVSFYFIFLNRQHYCDKKKIIWRKNFTLLFSSIFLQQRGLRCRLLLFFLSVKLSIFCFFFGAYIFLCQKTVYFFTSTFFSQTIYLTI